MARGRALTICLVLNFSRFVILTRISGRPCHVRHDEIGSKDRVVLYYSGHGKLMIAPGRSGQEIKQGYIVPHDSKRPSYKKKQYQK